MDYIITLKIPINSLDDVSARSEADRILTKSVKEMIQDKAELKLQRLIPGKPPEKVIYEFKDKPPTCIRCGGHSGYWTCSECS